MYVVYGQKPAVIKKFTDNHESCKSCKAFDLGVKVYRNYFHIYYIPVIPIGPKTAKIRCNTCGEPFRSQKQEATYEHKGRTPFYFYSLPIIILLVVACIPIYTYIKEHRNIEYVNSPKAGDVYQIKADHSTYTSYYFYRVATVQPDSITVLHSKLEYIGLAESLDAKDFFVKDDTLVLSRAELKSMLKSKEINSVERGYENAEGFNRIQ